MSYTRLQRETSPPPNRQPNEESRRSQLTVSDPYDPRSAFENNPSAIFARGGSDIQNPNYFVESGGRPPPPTTWSSPCISGIMKDFIAKAPLNNFAESERFLRQNPSILSRAANKDDFRSAAIDALLAARQTDRPESLLKIADLCMEKCVILSNCAADLPNRRDSFIERLAQKHRGTVNLFNEQLDNLKASCEAAARARQPSSWRVQDRSERGNDPGVTSLTKELATITMSPSSYTSPQGRHQVAVRQRVPQHDQFINRHGSPTPGAPEGQGAEDPEASKLSVGDVKFSAATTLRDPRFQPLDTKRWDNFFVLGRVFAIMTYNEDSRPEGDNDDFSVQSVRIGGRIVQAKVRRLVVVDKGHGYCWAIPILTYSSQGLAKPGLTPGDVAAHARIHMEGLPAQWRPNDPKHLVTKRDIMVDGPRSSRLHPHSMVNFEKIYTVEYNAKVMNIGKVSEKSIGYFDGYWKEVLQKKAGSQRG